VPFPQAIRPLFTHVPHQCPHRELVRFEYERRLLIVPCHMTRLVKSSVNDDAAHTVAKLSTCRRASGPLKDKNRVLCKQLRKLRTLPRGIPFSCGISRATTDNIWNKPTRQ